MSTKRTSAESTNDEQTDEDSGSPIQREDAAKRAKLDPQSNTTLHDLPLKILECIIVKTVVMEVMDLKLAKSVWKDEADVVVTDLRNVCSLWSDILTTNSFRTKLHRILNGTAQSVRLKILHETPILARNHSMTTLKDDVFLLYTHPNGRFVINVYSREDMEEVKEVIPLSGIVTEVQFMASCNVSNCVYVGLCRKEGNRDYLTFEVLRIWKGVDHKFNVSSWLNHKAYPCRMMTVSANGSLTALSYYRDDYNNSVVCVYNADGSMQRRLWLPKDTNVYAYSNVIQKSNGNVVVAYICDSEYRQILLELDTSGNVVRQFQSSVEVVGDWFVSLADNYDRMIVGDVRKGFEMLDSEFNLLRVYSLQKGQGKQLSLVHLHYDCHRNEIVRIHCDKRTYTNILTIFRLTEE